MIYSVFDWDSGQYDYYKGDGDRSGYRPAPRRKFNHDRGVPIEMALTILPRGAKKIGRGLDARGRVAVTEKEAAMAEYNPLEKNPWLTLGIWVGAFYIGSKFISWISGRIAR